MIFCGSANVLSGVPLIRGPHRGPTFRADHTVRRADQDRLSIETLLTPWVNDRYQPEPIGSAHPVNGSFRRRGDSAFHNAHASLGVAGHWAGLAGTMAPIVIGEFITDPTKRWRAVRLAVVGTATAVAHEALHAISELRRRKEQETKLAECQ